MKVVTVRNRLDEGRIIIREGNAGVYRQLAVVKAKKDFQLKIDPNATYREYVLITLPGNKQLPAFSSDDISEFSEIVVKENKTQSDSQRFYWEGDPDLGNRDPVPGNGDPVPATPGNAGPDATPGNAEPDATPGNAEPDATPGNGEPDATPGNAELDATPGNAEPDATPGNAEPDATPGNGEPDATPGNERVVAPSKPSLIQKIRRFLHF